ncbi:hypothetical protein DYB28_001995 [Aphanomyces astaci]|uniref:Uncharacterized protein n=1 Tax=Aphanomyces astaci TaxID=112090 RepID=A0A9X8DWI7_APHAT|nr:hypothetical protein DYB28_001995 [Aphanomyces astaci]
MPSSSLAYIRTAAAEDVRVAIVLGTSLLLAMWFLARRLSKGGGVGRVFLSDLARVECLSTDRLMHKVVLPARQPNASKRLVLLVPGNPGVPGFYEPFMQRLHALGGRDCEIVGLSHTGHSLPWINDNAAFDLETQVVDKVAYVRKRIEKDPTVSLVLIGHSIGCHIALRLLDQFPTHVEKLVLIQPAVMHIRDTPRGQQMMPLFVHHQWVAYLAWPIAQLPTLVKKVLVALAVPPPEFHKAALGMCDHVVVLNCLKMAWHEMHELKDINHALVADHQHKIQFVFSQHDGWCPPAHVELLRRRYVHANHVVVSLPHAFMMAANGSDVMADLAHAWLNETQLAAKPPVGHVVAPPPRA